MACTSNWVGWSINQDGRSGRCPAGVLRTVEGVMLEPLADAAGLWGVGAGLWGAGGEAGLCAEEPLPFTARTLPDLLILRVLAESCHHSFGSALAGCACTGSACSGDADAAGAAGDGSAT